MTTAKTMRRLIGRFREENSGVAAVEFGLTLPILAFGFLAMIDVAMAINGRMQVDSAVRSAAESTKTDPGVTVVRKVFDSAKNTSEDGVPSQSSSAMQVSTPALDVKRYCACPSAQDVAVSCNSICSGANVPYLFYNLVGTATYSGIFLNNISIKRTLRVQLR